jgi:ribonuclease BN (tRNA processing enzyme)
MANIRVKIIGSGDAFGSGGRLNTCFYLQLPQANLLIDCGATVLPGLKKQGIDVEQIDAIIISHFHGDHYGGIPFLLVEAAVTGRKKPLHIITPKDGKARIAALLELLYPGIKALELLDIVFLEYTAREPLQTEHFSLTAFPVIHSEASLPHGLRISIGNKIISYSGDTSWTAELVPLSAGADLFICECNFFSTQVKGHMNYLDLETKLDKLSYKRILLTHPDEEMLQELEHIKLDFARDGMDLII